MRTLHSGNPMHRNLDPLEERRLDAIIVAVTLAVILVAILGLVAIVDSIEPQRGGGSSDSGAVVVD